MRTLLVCHAILVVALSSCSKEKHESEAAKKMQDFVINISDYARSLNPNFIVIPQNGVELAFNGLDPDNGINMAYMAAVDGFGVEALFYNGAHVSLGDERLSMLQYLKPSKKIMVSEYISDNGKISEAINQNINEGFICFPRTSDNYHYSQIPACIINCNTTDITDISLAQNYLYLINSDGFASRQEMIAAISATDYDVVLIDLFYEGKEYTNSEILQLKTKANGAQRIVISYINIGAAEKFRFYWKKGWGLNHPLWLKKKYEGYKDEFWVKFWQKEWQDIIYGNNNSYVKKIVDAGFDGVYLDNVEGYYFLYNKD